MSRRALRIGLLITAGAALGGAGWWFFARTPAALESPDSELQERNRQIAFYEERVRRDPESALDLAQLAGLYLQRSRETGDHQDQHLAEAAARASLAERTNRNGKAFHALAVSLMGQHRFVEALDVATRLCETYPDEVGYQALLGEIRLELGAYEDAAVTFEHLAQVPGEWAVMPRLARYREVTGRTDDALALLSEVREEAQRRREVPREQLAWFQLRIGDLQSRRGRLSEAADAYSAGLELRPDDHRLLTAMARLELLRQHWTDAIEFGERAIRSAPEVASYVVLGDAYAALGKEKKAADSYSAAERFAREHSGSYDRAWLLYLLDHDLEVDETLEVLRAEHSVRRDVAGCDLLGWALYKHGDYAAAREMATLALRTGMEDGVLLYHAGKVELALNDSTSARRYFERALAVNPYFHPSYATEARTLLESIRPSGDRSSVGALRSTS